MLSKPCTDGLQLLMAAIARQSDRLDHSLVGYGWAYADKSVFRALGGLGHPKHIAAGGLPHSSINAAASWAKSEYHRWRFGDGLPLICNRYRFPLVATVPMAFGKEYTLLATLIRPLQTGLRLVRPIKAFSLWRFDKLCWKRFLYSLSGLYSSSSVSHSPIFSPTTRLRRVEC